MKKLITEMGFPTVDDLLASIGYGKTSIQQVLGRVAPAPPADSEAHAEAKPARPARKGDGPAVRIRGVDDLLVRFGKCCAPVPGDVGNHVVGVERLDHPGRPELDILLPFLPAQSPQGADADVVLVRAVLE